MSHACLALHMHALHMRRSLACRDVALHFTCHMHALHCTCMRCTCMPYIRYRSLALHMHALHTVALHCLHGLHTLHCTSAEPVNGTPTLPRRSVLVRVRSSPPHSRARQAGPLALPRSGSWHYLALHMHTLHCTRMRFTCTVALHCTCMPCIP